MGREQVGCVAKTHRDAERCVIARSTHPIGSRPSPAGARPGSTPRWNQGDPPCSFPAWTKRLRRGMGGAGWVGCADWGVIPWDFRPLWLEFFGPQPRKGITMSELSNRMIRDMQLAGLVEGTRREYLRGVRQLAAYYMVSPDQLSERNVEDYILYVRDDLGVAKGTFAPMFAGLKFFYLNTLGSDWPLFTKKKSAGHAGSGCPTSAVTRTAAA